MKNKKKPDVVSDDLQSRLILEEMINEEQAVTV